MSMNARYLTRRIRYFVDTLRQFSSTYKSSPGEGKNFHFSTSSRPALGSTQLPIQWVPEDLSPGRKLSGREADNSPLASAEVKKMWIYISTPHTLSWCSA
jgi:hypothetical protein